MGRILCFIYDNMADYEITFACHLLSFFGERQVSFAATGRNDIKGLSGMIYRPSMTLDEIGSVEEADALIIPGGWLYRCPEALIELIKKMNDAGRLICAICSAPYFLARAGVLEGRDYTTSLNTQSLRDLGEENDPFPWNGFKDEGVVRQGNLITAKANCFIEFGIEIYDALGLYESNEDKDACSVYFKGN